MELREFIIRLKLMTQKEVADLSLRADVPLSTVLKLRGGRTKEPRHSTIDKLTKVM
jgi:predicted transcriptional regulator